MASDEVKHDYHLVDPSPWPIVGSIAAFMAAVGAIAYFQTLKGAPPLFGIFSEWYLMAGGLALLAYTFVAWWRDVVNESVVKGDHTPVVKLHLRYGMILFIASEVMFFVAWFWAYFNSALFPTDVNLAAWPPVTIANPNIAEPITIATFDPWTLPLLNTLILLTSGTTVTWAHHAVQTGNQRGAVNGLGLTIILGLLFTCVQAYEYMHASFPFSGNIYGATFFMATGFHGFHVIVGTIFLIVCWFRARAGHFTPERHFGFEAAAWYWHFVDVVWLFLFASIYVWGAGTNIAAH
ncbi:MAG: cytochrome c oxidase subunit 3 [Alphaproteobacteria bacterium]|nr:cytochrome c oxidase subunit 3 [Alphaproteobacteria bacterium]